MTSEGPLVTVVIAAYNAGDYLRPSIESALAQTHRNLEILLVDDGSTDGSVESIRGLVDSRVRIIQQENRGKPAALNAALEQSHGDFYAVHDADDLSDPRRIEHQLRCLRENPDLAAAFCGNDLILGGRRVAPVSRFKDPVRCRADIEAMKMPAHDPTGMYRWSLVKGIGYDPSLPVVEGYDYILRVGERFPIMVIGECLYGYRIHPGSVTKRNPELRERLVREVLRRACARRGEDFTRRFPEQPTGLAIANRAFDNNLAAHFMDSVCDLRRVGERRRALSTGLACSNLHWLDPHYHKALAYAILPMRVVRSLRRTKD